MASLSARRGGHSFVMCGRLLGCKGFLGWCMAGVGWGHVYGLLMWRCDCHWLMMLSARRSQSSSRAQRPRDKQRVVLLTASAACLHHSFFTSASLSSRGRCATPVPRSSSSPSPFIRARLPLREGALRYSPVRSPSASRRCVPPRWRARWLRPCRVCF